VAVLFAVDVPEHHHEEHDHAPEERNYDPNGFYAIQRVFPP
jgi:hypothetical protein